MISDFVCPTHIEWTPEFTLPLKVRLHACLLGRLLSTVPCADSHLFVVLFSLWDLTALSPSLLSILLRMERLSSSLHSIFCPDVTWKERRKTSARLIFTLQLKFLILKFKLHIIQETVEVAKSNHPFLQTHPTFHSLLAPFMSFWILVKHWGYTIMLPVNLS